MTGTVGSASKRSLIVRFTVSGPAPRFQAAYAKKKSGVKWTSHGVDVQGQRKIASWGLSRYNYDDSILTFDSYVLGTELTDPFWGQDDWSLTLSW